MAESCCSSGKQREGEGDRNGNGGGWGGEDGWKDADEKGKEKPLERLSSPQSQPGTTVFLPARQPNRPPSVPAPAPEWSGGGIATSAALAAPFSPHPGAVHQAARRRRLRGDHRQAAGALWQAGWAGRHLQRDGGALAPAVSPASLPFPCAGRGGWDAPGRWLLRSDRQRWRKHGRAGTAARPRGVPLGWGSEGHARINPLPPPPRRGLGVSYASARCWCSWHSPQQAATPLDGGTPTGTGLYPHADRPQFLSQPPDQSCKQVEIRRGGGGRGLHLKDPCDLPVLWGTAESPGTNLLFMPMPQGTMPHSHPQKHPHDP